MHQITVLHQRVYKLFWLRRNPSRLHMEGQWTTPAWQSWYHHKHLKEQLRGMSTVDKTGISMLDIASH